MLSPSSLPLPAEGNMDLAILDRVDGVNSLGMVKYHGRKGCEFLMTLWNRSIK